MYEQWHDHDLKDETIFTTTGAFWLWCKYPASTDTPCCAVPISSNQYRVADSRHGLALKAQTRQCELALADAVHQLDAGDRDRSVRKPLEADHHGDAVLHAPMLLNQIVQVFRRS
jgi:hypothetical protein